MNSKKPSARKGKQPKVFTRPSASALSEAAARLSFINSMAPRRRPPVICNLSSDDEHNMTPIKEMNNSTASQFKPVPRFVPKNLGQQPQDNANSMPPNVPRRQEAETPRQRPIIPDSEDDEDDRVEALEHSSSKSGTKNMERRRNMSYLRSNLADNGRGSGNIHTVRPPTANVQTLSQGRATNQPSSQQHMGPPLYNEYDNGIPSAENIIRIAGHEIHAGCDVPLASIEDNDAD